MDRPRIAITMGDVAGIGPEVVARACSDPSVKSECATVIVGDALVLDRALGLIRAETAVRRLDSLASPDQQPDAIECFSPRTISQSELAAIRHGTIDPKAGRAAYDWLVAAAAAAREGTIDAIVTAPLNKAALHLAGIDEPGHTEVLAKACDVERYAMMLFVPPGGGVRSPDGLGVAHMTLHTSIESVPQLLTVEGIAEKILLLHDFLSEIGVAAPRIGVCALNPHGGEEGLFGDEEQRIIRPGIERAAASGIVAEGPIPADALLRRAIFGEFDGVVAMYHDQGHIPIKLVARETAINITLGLPIVRTSPSHGTAFDIAWKGTANPQGMIAAVKMAAKLARRRLRHVGQAASSPDQASNGT